MQLKYTACFIHFRDASNSITSSLEGTVRSLQDTENHVNHALAKQEDLKLKVLELEGIFYLGISVQYIMSWVRALPGLINLCGQCSKIYVLTWRCKT